MPPTDATGPAAARAGAPEYARVRHNRTGERGRIFAYEVDGISILWDGDTTPTHYDPDELRDKIEHDGAAPVRTLAPGIAQSADTCDGRPHIALTRFRTDATVGYPDYATFAASFPHIQRDEYERAVAFEAGRAWERERRAARKRKRLAKAWREGERAAKGARDGQTDAP